MPEPTPTEGPITCLVQARYLVNRDVLAADPETGEAVDWPVIVPDPVHNMAAEPGESITVKYTDATGEHDLKFDDPDQLVAVHPLAVAA